MRASHLHWIVASLFLLSGCGARSPYDDDTEACEVPASGGTTFGFGGNTYSGGTTSTGRGGTTTTWIAGGTTSYGARGGYGGSYGGVGGSGGVNVGGRGGAGGYVYGGGFAGAPRGGAGGNAGKGGNAGTAGRGGGGGVGIGGYAGTAGVNRGGTSGSAGVVVYAGSSGTGGMAGSAGLIGSSGTVGVGAAGGDFGGNVNVGGNGDGGITNVGGIGNGGIGNGGVTSGGTSTTGVAGATAGASPGGAGPWPGCVCSQPNCGTCPTTTVTVDRGSYFIDATETTNAEYSMFLAASVPIASQPAVCSWNLTFVPNVNWPLIGKDNMPVTWVDWCDAFAYCAWAGKRLCGAIGGGTAAFAESDNPGMNQWFEACTTGGTSIYPYGATYDATACNGADYGVEALVAVGTMSNCKTPNGIFDMSGNAYEWEDSCGNWTGETDVCHTRGGSYFTSDPNILRCRTASTLYTRNSVRSSIGFRCCADK